MNVGPTGLSNRDIKVKLLWSLYDLMNMPIFSETPIQEKHLVIFVLQPLLPGFLEQGSSNVSPPQPFDRSTFLKNLKKNLNHHYRRINTWHLPKSKLVWKFSTNQRAHAVVMIKKIAYEYLQRVCEWFLPWQEIRLNITISIWRLTQGAIFSRDHPHRQPRTFAKPFLARGGGAYDSVLPGVGASVKYADH